MNCPYKILVSNKSIHREFEISENVDHAILGTVPGCDFRLDSDDFFSPVELAFIEKDGQWHVLCNDSLYFSFDDVRKLKFSKLNHGDHFQVKYADNGSVVFDVVFSINFESQIPAYDLKIDVSDAETLFIGGTANSDVILKSDYCDNALIVLKRNGNEFIVEEKSSRYGVHVNGNRISGSEELSNSDFLSISDSFFYYTDGFLFTDKEKVLVRDLKNELVDTSLFEYPIFVRNTRRRIEIDETSIKILDPSQKPNKPDLNLLTSLLPALLMLVLVIVIRGFMSSTSNGYILFSLCSMGLGIIVSIASMIQGRRKYKKELINRETVYKNYITKKEKEIVEARCTELESLYEIYTDHDALIKKVMNFESDIFDRTIEDRDYLDVLLGYGRREAQRQIECRNQEQLEDGDDLSQIPEKLSEQYRYISDAPIIISLKEANVIGITGSMANCYELFKLIIADLICRQFPDEMEFIVLTDGETKSIEWIKSLPQLQRNDGRRNISYDSGSRNSVFDYLYKELTYRKDNAETLNKHLIVFSLSNNGIVNHPISKFFANAAKLQTTFVFFERSADFLPLHCNEIIEVQDEYKGFAYSTSDKTTTQEFTFKPINDNAIRNLVVRIAPVRYKEISLESSLRKRYSMFEMLGIYRASDLDIEATWEKSKIYESMAVPIGINAKDEIIYLDLNEKAHGPHGLVAGTTGSGKSELLQTFIVSCAIKFPPQDIGFVLIDFKGGGMANQLKQLPHLIGTITNIDGKEIERSLKSLKAELIRRQELFAKAGVNQIDKYIKLYKDGSIDQPLPHLIVIVDEFAELKAEQPDFMKELISAARIGRSLGVHLILATQKPAGQVSEQIWSNSKFKICLKVQETQDSVEVIKSPLAAEIKEPGRAYLQVGNNETFELLQSAYCGGPAVREDDEKNKSFTIYSYDIGGRQEAIYEQKRRKVNTDSNTELDVIVETITAYCDKHSIDRLNQICLPGLKDSYDYKDFKWEEKDAFTVPIGIYDDPEHQKQDSYILDIGKANTIIVGSSQMGKTNALQAIIRCLSERCSPSQVNFYIADFGSLQLKKFEKLATVGGVVTPQEDEKFKNLIKLLLNEIEYRKELFLQKNVTSYSSYLEVVTDSIPQIMVIIDNFTALKEMYLHEDDGFIQICRDGLSLGISVIIANSATTGFGYKYLSLFANRIALYCNDSSEYGTLFDFCRMRIDAIPGRCIVDLEKHLYECQLINSFTGNNEIEQAHNIESFIESCNKCAGEKQAKAIPEVPEEVTVEFLRTLTSIDSSTCNIALGIDYSSVEPFSLDFSYQKNPIVICGDDMHRQNIFLSFIIDRIGEMYEKKAVYIIDNIKRELATYQEKDYVKHYSYLSDDILNVVEDIERCVAERYGILSSGGDLDLNKSPLILLAINNNDAIEAISSNPETMTLYKNIIGRYKLMNVCIILCNFENAAINYSAPEAIRMARDAAQFFFFDNIARFKISDIPLSVVREYKNNQHKDDFFFINDGLVERIKTISNK